VLGNSSVPPRALRPAGEPWSEDGRGRAGEPPAQRAWARLDCSAWTLTFRKFWRWTAAWKTARGLPWAERRDGPRGEETLVGQDHTLNGVAW